MKRRDVVLFCVLPFVLTLALVAAALTFNACSEPIQRDPDGLDALTKGRR